jgi:hypothetical protein
LAVTLLLAAGAGCTNSPNGNPSSDPTSSTTTPPPTAASATPTVTPSPPSSEPPIPGKAEVVALVKKYYAIDDAVARDRSVPVSRYKEVAGGEWSKTIRAYTTAARLRGERVKGRTKITEPKVMSLSPAQDPTVARVTVCVDVRAVQVFNKQGESIVPSNRPDFSVERLVVRKTKGAWLVYEIRDKSVKAC